MSGTPVEFADDDESSLFTEGMRKAQIYSFKNSVAE